MVFKLMDFYIVQVINQFLQMTLHKLILTVKVFLRQVVVVVRWFLYSHTIVINHLWESGGFIRGLNCSSGYGEKGAVANGTLATETAVTVNSRGEILKYATAGFLGGGTESDVSNIGTQGQGTATAIALLVLLQVLFRIY